MHVRFVRMAASAVALVAAFLVLESSPAAARDSAKPAAAALSVDVAAGDASARLAPVASAAGDKAGCRYSRARLKTLNGQIAELKKKLEQARASSKSTLSLNRQLDNLREQRRATRRWLEKHCEK